MVSSTEAKYEGNCCRSRDGRIGAAIGVAGHPRLPGVSSETLLKYRQYLLARLSFPFEACHHGDLDSAAQTVTVIGLLDTAGVDVDPSVGLMCMAQSGGKEAALPLVDLELSEENVNFQLVEDYWYWFWNWQYQTPRHFSSSPR